MSRRNRKKTKANGYVFPVPFAGIVIIAATLGIAYIWLGCRCESLSRVIKTLEIEREVLARKCANEEIRWTRMKSPRNMEKILARNNIVMTWPDREHVVHLADGTSYADESEETSEDALKYITMAMLERVQMNE